MGSVSASPAPEIAIDASPLLRLYKDGTVERLVGTAITPPGLDPETGVVSKDVVFDPKTRVSARLYCPKSATGKDEKLPLAVYFHGGGFFISSSADPVYHQAMNRLSAAANSIIASINYRLAPETPLPAAFDDCWSALAWLGSGNTAEPWIDHDSDLNRVILVGDSAGANIAHNMICRFSQSDPKPNIRISSAALVHPYFWGEALLPLEARDSERKAMIDQWWKVVCPSERGNDDPLINPFASGAPSLDCLKSCEKIVVMVAEHDILRERGLLYYDAVSKSPLWKGEIKIVEDEGEDHVFHLFKPDAENSKKMVNFLADFIALK